MFWKMLKRKREKTELLAKDLEKFKLAVDGASDNIVITDTKGIILYVNPAIEKTTGYIQQECLGKTPGELWGSIMTKKFYTDLWQKIKVTKDEYRGETHNHRKDGESYTAEIHVSPVVVSSGEIEFFISIERDITKLKEVDRMKTEFLSLASHQLRTPLSAIRWYTEMLEDGDGGELNEPQKDFVSNISKSTIRMIELVNSLLNISRIESGRIIIEPEPTKVYDLIKGVRDELEVKLKEKKIDLVVNMHHSLPTIVLDQKLIRNVFMNLLTNAIKYSPPGKSVTVLGSKKDNDLLIQVTDEGYGIPEKEQGKLFQKFFRATNVIKVETEGNGLGLYLVKSIIDSSGGKIWFRSKPGEGTTFWFTLPLKGVPAKDGEVRIDS